MREDVQMICPTAQTQNLLCQGWTGRINLSALEKFDFWRNWFYSRKPVRRDLRCPNNAAPGSHKKSPGYWCNSFAGKQSKVSFGSQAVITATPPDVRFHQERTFR
jgi:hypothetical protein